MNKLTIWPAINLLMCLPSRHSDRTSTVSSFLYFETLSLCELDIRCSERLISRNILYIPRTWNLTVRVKPETFVSSGWWLFSWKLCILQTVHAHKSLWYYSIQYKNTFQNLFHNKWRNLWIQFSKCTTTIEQRAWLMLSQCLAKNNPCNDTKFTNSY